MGAREIVGRLLWHAHPARPGPERARLEESQWWPRERLDELRAERLRALVRKARSVAFYRERLAAAGYGDREPADLDELVRLPILERADLERLGVAGLRTPGSWGMRARSSGSLGRRVEFLWPLSEMRWRDAAEARAHAWLGTRTGERRLEVRCRPVGAAQRVAAILLNAEAIHAPSVADREVVRRLLAAADRRPPALVWGVSNALYTAALALLDEGRAVPTRACWSGGNHLHDHYREALGEAFRCPVYERYATMETGLVAHECVEAGALHVPGEGVIAEIVRADGTRAAPGEEGDVLLTALSNGATPLIRYRVGDRAVVPEPGPCPCGRGLPVFGRVAGRAPDVLRGAGGRILGPRDAVAALRPLLGARRAVRDFQAIQEADGSLRVLVVQDGAPEGAAARARVAAIFEDLVAPPRPAAVERVERLPLTPGGKVRTLISNAA